MIMGGNHNTPPTYYLQQFFINKGPRTMKEVQSSFPKGDYAYFSEFVRYRLAGNNGKTAYQMYQVVALMTIEAATWRGILVLGTRGGEIAYE